MTGELFYILASHSILARLMQGQDGVGRQDVEQLACHVSLEAGDLAAAYAAPLAVRAGRHDEGLRVGAHDAEHLGLFAPHDVGQPPARDGAETRHDPGRAQAGFERDHSRRNRPRVCRAGDVGRLEPAFPAPHHPAQDNPRRRAPVRDQCAQYGLERAARQPCHSVRRRARLEDGAVRSEAKRAEVRSTPIDPDGKHVRGAQWLSRGTPAPRLPTRKSRSAPWFACWTWSK